MSNGDEVGLFSEEEDEELVRAVEESLISPPPSEVAREDSAFTAYPPFQVDQATTSSQGNDDFPDGLMGLQEDDWNGRSYTDKKFQCVRAARTFFAPIEIRNTC